MSGYTRISVIFGLVAFFISLALSVAGIGWALFCVLPLAALAGGYVGGAQSKDDPSKTARNTRRGAFAGSSISVLGLFGSYAAAFIGKGFMDFGIVDLCLGALLVAAGAAMGGVGGWAYVRHEHERQTGYKPT